VQVEQLVKLQQQDIFAADISTATIIFMYLFREGLQRMKRKLETEVRSEIIVVSVGFQVPGWQTAASIVSSGLHIYIYKMPQNSTGSSTSTSSTGSMSTNTDNSACIS
jgi:hypothetical protein